MIINHIVQRREERRQRKARWMLSRCFTQEVQITDIIIEEPIVIPDVIIEEPIVMEEPIIIVVEPIVIEAKATVSTKHIDEAAQVRSTSNVSLETEELRKLLILHQTIKKLSSKKK